MVGSSVRLTTRPIFPSSSWQIMRGPMHSGMVHKRLTARGKYLHTDFTQDEQRELWLLPWMPSARNLRNRTPVR